MRRAIKASKKIDIARGGELFRATISLVRENGESTNRKLFVTLRREPTARGHNLSAWDEVQCGAKTKETKLCAAYGSLHW